MILLSFIYVVIDYYIFWEALTYSIKQTKSDLFSIANYSYSLSNNELLSTYVFGFDYAGTVYTVSHVLGNPF